MTKRWQEAWERATAIAVCGHGAVTDDCPMRDNDYELENAIAYDMFQGQYYDWQAYHDLAASLALDGAPISELP